jgi:hypothetical protein
MGAAPSRENVRLKQEANPSAEAKLIAARDMLEAG